MLKIKSCKNCIHWQDIKKTLDVTVSCIFDSNVTRRAGACELIHSIYGNYTTEAYSCEKWERQKNEKNNLVSL